MGLYIHILCAGLLLISFTSIFDAKHHIGCKFVDPEVQADMKHFSFTVFSKDGKPYIKVQCQGEEKEFVSVKLYQYGFDVYYIVSLVTQGSLHGSLEDEGDHRVVS